MGFKKCVDYTLLKPESTLADFARLCREAKEHSDVVRSVCVLPDPDIIEVCIEGLKRSDILICCVNDFPLGRGGAEFKEEQALITIDSWTKRDRGVDEIDTVINAGALRGHRWKTVLEELKRPVGIFDGRVKVILETGHKFYTEYLIKKGTEIIAEAGAFCVKTSTGFIENIPVEEKVQHVKWMHEAVPEISKKIAGGLGEAKDAEPFFNIVPADKLIFGASKPFWLR